MTYLGSAFVKSEWIRASEGGTVTVLASDSATLAGASIQIPPNALSADTRISIGYGGGTDAEWIGTPSATATIVPQGVPRAGPVVYFGPDGTAFRLPVTVTLPFAPASGSVTELVVYALEGNGRSYEIPHDGLQISGSLASFSVSGLTQFQPGGGHPAATRRRGLRSRTHAVYGPGRGLAVLRGPHLRWAELRRVQQRVRERAVRRRRVCRHREHDFRHERDDVVRDEQRHHGRRQLREHGSGQHRLWNHRGNVRLLRNDRLHARVWLCGFRRWPPSGAGHLP
jgi:hypothetical protein